MGKNLLILGAGGHGKVVCEVALSMMRNGVPVYDKVNFLDDNSTEAIGKLADLERFKGDYEAVFCGIGNNAFRRDLLKKAEELGFEIPVLIHESAYISPTATIEKGTLIEPKAVVNANSIIKRGVIISVGAIVDHDAVIEECVHVNAGSICAAGSCVEKLRRLEAGEIVLGYEKKKLNK